LEKGWYTRPVVKPSRDNVAASITEAQRQLETALSALEHMPMLSPDAIAFAAHALDNYLTVSGGTIELLKRSLKDHRDPEVMKWLDGLQRVTESMSHTINLLMGTAAHAGPELRRERVDMAVLVRRCCNFYERVAGRKQIRIVFDAPSELPNAAGDRVAIAAVMDNLLSNAVKFSDPGKTVTVAVRYEPPSIVCSVRDEGPGLKDEDRQQLFQRGASLSAKPTAGESSNGYGLAVAKDLVDRQQGEIWCESAPGRGAEFLFKLPIFR
jgi:two-component system sensor histidine kinase/response regulator